MAFIQREAMKGQRNGYSRGIGGDNGDGDGSDGIAEEVDDVLQI